MTVEPAICEVERRYSITVNNLPQIEQKLTELRFKPSYLQHQIDEYFTSKHKDFISSEECLRIRSINDRTILTWKPPTTTDMRSAPEFWKEEIEFAVAAQPRLIKRFLEALDFIPYVTVEKVRTAYINSIGVEISIDKVSHLGTFMEIEIKSADVARARRQLADLARDLHLSDADISDVPYRDLVATKS